MFTEKDVFLSYGRKESLAFTAQLHQQIKLLGKSVWFDKVNIPSGDDYRSRIRAGIRSAHNFVFVVAPHSVTSPHCLAELQYAEQLGKRIFPLIHLEEPPGLLATYQPRALEIREQVFAIIGDKDWIFARENPGDLQALRQWQESYENQWPAHEDLSFLEKWQCPIKWSQRDKLEEVMAKLMAGMGREEAFVQQHTHLLVQAHHWEAKGCFNEDLLTGKERIAAEEWLKRRFSTGLPPCTPVQLQARYVTASRKNARNLMTEAFISYSTNNRPIMQRVVDALEMSAITTWVHFQDIDINKTYAEEITKGVEQADNILFFLSSDSLSSYWCISELMHAFALNKRVIPLKIGETEGYQLPEIEGAAEVVEKLLTLQYVDFTDNKETKGGANHEKSDFAKDIDEILRKIQQDFEYYQQHKILLNQALRWRKFQKPTYLLTGHNLEKALTWLRLYQEREDHPPTSLHLEFIQTSAQSKGMYPSEVFISYSRKDSDFARKLNQRLQEVGRFTWFDQESIASGVDFDQEIFSGIEKAYNFLFIISPDSVASDFCEKELKYAAQVQKRFIPVLWNEAEGYEEKLPEEFKNIQWVNFKHQEFEAAFQALTMLLDHDRSYVESHVRWQQWSLEWLQNQRNPFYLLNSSALKESEIWLLEAYKTENLAAIFATSQPKSAKQPSPTGLQREFIKASRAAVDEAERKEKKIAAILAKRLRYTRIAAGVAIFLFLAVLSFIYLAFRWNHQAKMAAAQAMLSREHAEEAQMRAQRDRAIAEQIKLELERNKDLLATQSELVSAYKQRQIRGAVEEFLILLNEKNLRSANYLANPVKRCYQLTNASRWDVRVNFSNMWKEYPNSFMKFTPENLNFQFADDSTKVLATVMMSQDSLQAEYQEMLLDIRVDKNNKIYFLRSFQASAQ